MEEDEQRNVFNANLVLDRKALITTVGIDHEGSRVFLGVEEGMLEEYSLDIIDTRPTCSLAARKPIAAKVRTQTHSYFLQEKNARSAGSSTYIVFSLFKT